MHLKSGDIDVRIALAEALGRLKTSPAVVPELVVLLADRRAVVRAAAVEALAELGPTAAKAIPALERAANDDYLTVKLAAEDALAAIRKTTSK